MSLQESSLQLQRDHERCALLLVRHGRLPSLPLGHLDFRVLLFLLGQKPGAYAAHHHTIAAHLDSNVTSVRAALRRLKASRLVDWERIPPHHVLPTGRYSRTNICRYGVDVERLAGLLRPPASPLPRNPMRTASPPNASTQPFSRPSFRTTDLRSEQIPPPSPPFPSRQRACADAPYARRVAVRPRTPPAVDAPLSRVLPAGITQEAEILSGIRESWEGLGLGPCDQRSVRALENRMREGATREELEAAIAGAEGNDWLRRHARAPFAVVFASIASIRRFAHEGRKTLGARAVETKRVKPQPVQMPEGLRAWRSLPRPSGRAAPLPSASLTPEQFAERRAEQLARAQAWALASSAR